MKLSQYTGNGSGIMPLYFGLNWTKKTKIQVTKLENSIWNG